jgi:hypothetical protein
MALLTPQQKTILTYENPTTFNEAFQKHIGIGSFEKEFPHRESLLWMRKGYLYDSQASVAGRSEVEKILLYEKAIACVAHAASLLNGPKAEQYWYNQHYLAKLYYNQ